MLYNVIWEIDIDASSAKEAAEKALEIQRDPESIAMVFQIKSSAMKEPKIVDLLKKK